MLFLIIALLVILLLVGLVAFVFNIVDFGSRRKGGDPTAPEAVADAEAEAEDGLDLTFHAGVDKI